MKRQLLLTISLTLLLPLLTFASSFNLKIANGQNLTIIFDNNQFQVYGSDFNLTNIQPGSHFIKIIENSNYGHNRVIYQSHILIPQATRVQGFLNHRGQLQLTNHPERRRYTYNHPHSGHAIHQPDNTLIFAQLLMTIEQTSFDNQKLLIAKQAIRNNYISSQQVLTLMQRLSFESNRIELAKFASHFVTDRQNYYLVNNGFSFSSSVWELNRYLNQNFG